MEAKSKAGSILVAKAACSLLFLRENDRIELLELFYIAYEQGISNILCRLPLYTNIRISVQNDKN